MRSLRHCRPWAGILCFVAACGEAPDPPGAIVGGSSAGVGGAGGTAILEALPAPAAPTGGTTAPDVVSPPPVVVAPGRVDAGVPAGPPAGASSQRFTACSDNGSPSCDSIYITMQDPAADLCVQMNVQSCGSYSRPGLAVVTPLSWRLASASVTGSATDCAPRAYYLDSVPVVVGSGNLAWNVKGLQPSQFVIDVTLQTSRATEASIGVPASVRVVTKDIVAPIDECDDG
jgi:hypothetical protein